MWRKISSYIPIGLVIGFVFLIGYCGKRLNDEKVLRKKSENAKAILDSLQHDSINESEKIKEVFAATIAKEYNAYYQPNNLYHAQYTYQLQKDFAQFDNNYLIDEYYIVDVSLNDSAYYVKVRVRNCIINVRMTKDFFERFQNYCEYEYYEISEEQSVKRISREQKKVLLLMHVKKLSKIAFSVDAEGYIEDEGNAGAELIVNTSHDFSISADLSNLFINE